MVDKFSGRWHRYQIGKRTDTHLSTLMMVRRNWLMLNIKQKSTIPTRVGRTKGIIQLLYKTSEAVIGIRDTRTPKSATAKFRM